MKKAEKISRLHVDVLVHLSGFWLQKFFIVAFHLLIKRATHADVDRLRQEYIKLKIDQKKHGKEGDE